MNRVCRSFRTCNHGKIYTFMIVFNHEMFVSFSENENFFNAISQISDPAYAFNIIIPILSTFNTILTADILMVSVIAEWSNVILKWLIREDRPYWWIREFHENKKGYPYLKQGPLTCETGPGSPSGHVMGSAAILYVLVKACIRFYSARNEKYAVIIYNEDI